MRILSITWNTHGVRELPPFRTTADVVIISLQECYKLPNVSNARKMLRYFASESMHGLQTIILSRSRMKTNAARVGLGPCGFVNKGFIAMRINGNILHVNAHLQAHSCNHKRRLRQLRSILEFCRAMDAEQAIDTVILSGDLNFRMEGGIDQSADFLRLFPQFREPKIRFQPTYKYKGNALMPSKTPSYCDRVFVASKHILRFIAYTSMPHVTVSDHKPVACEFSIKTSLPLTKSHAAMLFCSRARSMVLNRLLTDTYLFCIDSISFLSALVLILVWSALMYYR